MFSSLARWHRRSAVLSAVATGAVTRQRRLMCCCTGQKSCTRLWRAGAGMGGGGGVLARAYRMPRLRPLRVWGAAGHGRLLHRGCEHAAAADVQLRRLPATHAVDGCPPQRPEGPAERCSTMDPLPHAWAVHSRSLELPASVRFFRGSVPVSTSANVTVPFFFSSLHANCAG